MSRTTIQKIYNELKPEVIYEASKKALTDLGHEVYKQRPFSYLGGSSHNHRSRTGVS